MSTIYTRKCIICGSPDIYIVGGHVIRKHTFVNCGKPVTNIMIIASRCEAHKNEFRKHGYFGEYKDWMGMCDNPFKKDEDSNEVQEKEKMSYEDIAENILDIIYGFDMTAKKELADHIGISCDDFDDFLGYAEIVEVGDIRDSLVY